MQRKGAEGGKKKKFDGAPAAAESNAAIRSMEELFSAPTIFLPKPPARGADSSPAPARQPAGLKNSVSRFQWNAYQIACLEREEHGEYVDTAIFIGMTLISGARLWTAIPEWYSFFAASGKIGFLVNIAFELAVFSLLSAFIARHAFKAQGYLRERSELMASSALLLAEISAAIPDDGLKTEIANVPRTPRGLAYLSVKLRPYAGP